MKGKAKAQEFVDEGYKVHVTGRNVLVTEAMKNYSIDKISKIERLSPRLLDVTVTMDIQKIEHKVDIVIKVDHVKIKSQAASTDMYASVDKAVDKIERQLRRYKKRIHDHNAKALNVVDMKVNVLKRPQDEDLMDINMEIEDANQKELLSLYRPHEIVSQETRPLSFLTGEEAVMKMELSGDAFLIFKNEITHRVDVIYRRSDDNYGIIEVES